MRNLKVLGIAVIAILVVAAVFVGYREWQYQSGAALREGISAVKGGNFELALARIQPLAIRGDSRAQRLLGEMYARGFGVPADEARAEMWFRRAECRCDAPGQNEYDLALDLSHGGRDSPDTALAVRWLQRAAEAGHPRAQNLLADPAALRARGLKVESSVIEYWRHRTAQ